MTEIETKLATLRGLRERMIASPGKYSIPLPDLEWVIKTLETLCPKTS